MKANLKELDGIIDAKLPGTVESRISAALERAVSSTQSSAVTPGGMLATASEELNAGRAGYGQVIQGAFAHAAGGLAAVKG